MKNLKIILIILLSFFIASLVYPQKSLIKKGDKAYNEGDHLLALEYYEQFINTNEQIGNITIVKIANCYYYLKNYPLANKYFTKLIDEDLSIPDIINFAKLLQNLGKYSEAEKMFVKAIEKGEKSPLLKTFQQSCKWAIENSENIEGREVQLTDINTYGKPFGLQYYKDGIIYSTILQKEAGQDEQQKGISEQKYLDLCYSTMKDGIIGEPQLFTKTSISRYHKGSVSFTEDYNTIFFTKSIEYSLYKTDYKFIKSILKIYQAIYDGKDWVDIKELSFNSDEYSCQHPSVSPDGMKLFFSSDMPGGEGGKDLYVVYKQGTIWGPPINLGDEVNTPGDEIFPFINKKNILYFSSDGSIGYGGFDIYYAINKNGTWTLKTNIRKPVNSSKDDLAYVINPENDKHAFFSSNRIGKGDYTYIFSSKKLDLSPDTLKGQVIDNLTDKPVVDASVAVINKKTDKTLDKTKTDYEGKYELLVQKVEEGEAQDRKLQIEIKKQGYTDKHIDLFDEIFNKINEGKLDIEMKAENVALIAGNVFNSKTNEPLEAEIIFELLSDTKVETQTIKSDPENGDYKITLVYGNNYSFSASLKDFISSSDNIDLTDISQYKKINKDIYLAPVEVGQTVRIKNIFFDSGKATLRPESYTELNRVVNFLNENPIIEIEIAGHTDNTDSDVANLKLSQARSNSVKNYIVSNGIDESRIIAKGYGETKPIDSNDTEEGRQLNRRVEFTILKK